MEEQTATPKPKRSHHKKKPDPNALVKTLPADPLERLITLSEEGDLSEVLKLIFWKQRLENPEFTLQLDPKDLKGFNDCVEYLEVHPIIKVHRPGGVPAQDGSPAHGNRRAVPARDAIPPKPYAVVQMVDVSGDAFRPIENNQEDRDRQIKADALRRSRDNALVIAKQLSTDLASGTMSSDTIGQAVIILQTLARQ